MTLTDSENIHATLTLVNPLCNGDTGTVTVNAAGGYGSYTYSHGSVSPGPGNIFTLPAGTYTIQVTDTNSCFFDTSLTLTQPPLLTATTTPTNITCNGGSDGTVLVTAAGGRPGYSYSIDAGPYSTSGMFSGLSAGVRYIAVRDTNGCITIDTVMLTQPPPLMITSVTTVIPSCHGLATGAFTITASGGTSGYTYAYNSSAYTTTRAFTGLAAGTYTLYVKDANGCIKDTTLSLLQPAALSIGAAAQNPLCNPFTNGHVSIIPSGGTPGYTYAIGSGTYSSTYLFDSLGAATYTFYVKDTNGCTADTTIILADSEKIEATLILINPLCNGDTGAVAVIATGGYGSYIYAYDATPPGTVNSFTLSAGAYTIQVTDTNGCSFDTSFTLTQPPTLIATVTATNISCNGSSDGSVLVAASGGTAGYQYSINGGVPGTSGIFSGLAAGAQYIAVQDSNGCITADTVTITQPPLLVITSVTTVIPACHGLATGAFTITASGGTSGYTYAYNSSAYTATATFTGLAAGVYTLYVKDANGCVKDTILSLSQPAALSMRAIVRDPVCTPFTNGQVSIVPAGGTPGYTFAISSGAYGSAYVFDSLGPGTYTCSVKDSNGCISHTIITLTDSLHVVAAITISAARRYGQASGGITVLGGGGSAPYSYAIDTGAYSGSGAYSLLNAGTYTIHIADQNGCKEDTTVSVSQPSGIVPGISITGPSCYHYSDGSFTVTATGGSLAYTSSLNGGAFAVATTYGTLYAGIDSVVIKDSHGCLHDTVFTILQPAALGIESLVSANVRCYGGVDGSVTVTGVGATAPYQYAAGTGSYQISTLLSGLSAGTQMIYVRDSHGCTTDTAVTLTQPAPLLFTSADTVNPTCFGYKNGSVALHAAGGTLPYRYSSDNVIYHTSDLFDTLAAGTYTFYVKDSNLCTADTTITFSGLLPITIGNMALSAAACYGTATGGITVTAGGGVQPLFFTLGKTVKPDSSGMFDSLTAGTYNIIITDSRNCTIDTSVTIGQPDSLSIQNMVTPNECSGLENKGAAQVLVKGGTVPFTYLWSTDPAQTTTSISGLANGAYTAWVTDAGNCRDSTTLHITYDDCCTPFIPNAFTPNNDGKDDIFRIRFKGDMTIVIFSVYNRFGQLVYSISNTSNADLGWDGRLNGAAAEMGTYYYYAKIICGNKGDHTVELKGDVTLIR